MLGTNPTKAECLSIGNDSFTVFGMATVGLEVLVRVCRFYMEVALKLAILYIDPCIQKRDLLQ